MRNWALLLCTTTLAACGGGGGVQTAGSLSLTPAGTGAQPVPTKTTSTGELASVHTFVKPTEKRTYQSQAASQTYAYDYAEEVEIQKIVARDAQGDYLINRNTGDYLFTTVPNIWTKRDKTTGLLELGPDGRPIELVEVPNRRLLDVEQKRQLYTPFTSSVRAPGASVTYDPTNAQFTVVLDQQGAKQNITFQDPAHRTNFAGAVKPQVGVPNLEVGDPDSWRTKGMQYLQVANPGSGGLDGRYDVSTFFYELPGTVTQYVTYAGFVRNEFDKTRKDVTRDTAGYEYSDLVRATKLTRAQFVFGEATAKEDIPKTGTATYSGNMIATMINNPEFDKNPKASSYFQWMSGTAKVSVDFATASVLTTLSGTVLEPLIDVRPVALGSDGGLMKTDINGFIYNQSYIPKGAVFSAAGAGTIDWVKTGGFTGGFSKAQFDYADAMGRATVAKVDIVGGSLDGAFYGPKAAEVGATFRIIGGIPDQRVDITGAFTAAPGK